ncbi:MAG TPA: TonB-dependent receptor [Bryobacterales bacterium]|nr:TonB-dependent receptor [Bryobacterales bacterium]
MSRLVFACLVGLVLSAGFALGQSKATADLSGMITDPSDAVIPGAKVSLTSADTGVTRITTSSDRGEYRFLLLPPGAYDVKVEKDGFSTESRKGVGLTVGQAATLDFKLAVGSSTQIVEIQTETPMIETESTQQANTIAQEAVVNLPINRRDYLTFALLAPGVSDSKALADATSFRVKQTPDSGLSFYGSNGRGNSISVDGGESNDAGGGVRPTVSQETVQEFQVNRTNYSAEHGSARGGVINIVTKSGSNDLHGSAFGFFRNQNLDAGDPFALALQGDRAVRVKPDSNRQQFGGTLGGPVVKDRTFFFAGYEQLRRREFVTVPVLTSFSIFQPTPDQEAILGNLPANQAGPLRAALTAPPSTVDMFKSNSGVFPFQSDSYQGLVRLDHRINDSNQLNFRYNVTKDYETNQNLAALVGFSRGYIQDFFDSTALASLTHLFSPQVINEARVQFNYYNPFTGSNDPYGPAIEIPGYGFFNRDRFLPNDTITRREELADNVSIVRGNHSLKLGAYTLIRQNTSNSATFFSGRFTFGTLPGAFVSPALASTTITALQAFNLGLAQSYQQGFGDPIVRAVYPLYAGFVEDAWRVTPKLTLNLGVRYEVDQRKPPMPTNKKNFGPRFGFAWDPGGNHKTVIRGGYGLFYAAIDYQIDYVVNALNEINGYRQIAQVLTVLSAANPLAVNGPVHIFQTLRAQGIIGVPTPQRSILASDLAQFGINVSQTGPRPPLTVLFHNSPDYQNPYAQQASFEIEREVAPGLSVSAGYIFVRGVHLTTSRDDNLLPAPVNPLKGIRDWGPTPDNPTGTKYFKDPLLFQSNVYESTANSWYNGLTLEASKRFSRNVSFNFNYTFSKAIDETVDYNSDFQPNDQTCRRCERALSSFDERHKVVLYGVFETPAAGGRAGWRKALADFTLAPVFRYDSPRPFNLLAGSELNNDRHNTTDRPFFAGRNTGIGPSFWTFDTRLARRIRFGERARLDLMAEGFNLFNKLNFGSVNNTVGNIPGPFNVYGRDDRTPSQPLGFTSAFDPRRIQLGLRVTF